MAYVDNGDGTITDRNTGLMWEKKLADGGLHDWGRTYVWSGDGTEETVWDWLDDVNAEDGTGFAGHDDWRIPNAKELQSIIDYQLDSPSIHPIFSAPCTEGCSGTACSCTKPDIYWSSGSVVSSPTSAWFVDFIIGGVSASGKTDPFFVRAVRGGL